MKYVVIFIFSFYSGLSFSDYLFVETSLEKKWTDIFRNQDMNKLNLIETLEKTPTGKKVLELARKKAISKSEKLTNIILKGEVSLTDTSLIRKFQKNNLLDISFEQTTKVYINRDKYENF